MIYKKFIKNKDIRLRILSLLSFIPDELMIRFQYWIKTGRLLNLSSPVRYTEKIQWYKLNYRNALVSVCSDKYHVRNFVQENGYSYLLNELYGVYEKACDIDFDKLPDSFAIKDTNGSGKNIFVRDKYKEDIESIRSQISSWLDKGNINYGREWGYNNVTSKIIIEALLPRDENNDLPDYKFFCFDGRVEFLYTMVDYVDDHDAGCCSFFDRDFNQLKYRRSEYKEIDRNIPKPENFEEMIKIAEKLSSHFPHVRVDFYNISGRIVFGELTFYNASGYTVFDPDEFDFIMGSKFTLSK